MSRDKYDEAKIAFETAILMATEEKFREEARMKLAEIAEKEGNVISAQGIRLSNAVNRLGNLFKRNLNEQRQN
jgi:hypothetical protein